MTNFMNNFRPLNRFFATIATICTFFAPYSTSAADNSAQGVKVIVLDPGHGGRFAGATYQGISEKDINLQVVLKLGALLKEKMPDVKVVYTRTTDMMHSSNLGADLQARADIAHRNNADLFISVHSNAMPGKPHIRGTLTLIMGETSREVDRNETALYNNNKEEMLDMSDHKTATIVRAYIQNLQYTYGAYSEMMARFIQDEYAALGYRDFGVRGQPLKVLYSTDMPSVLTEIGFMTNPDELAYITSEEGQEKIVGALYRAIEKYIEVVNRSLLVDKSTTSTTTQKRPKTTTTTKPTTKEVAKPKAEPTTQPKPEQPKPEQTKPEVKTVKRYTIQIMAGNERVPTSQINIKNLQHDKVWILETTGAVKYKYCYGDFADRAAAQQQIDEVHKDFPQAFIIPYEK